MNNFFEGYYYKHVKHNDVLCLIAGKSDAEKFIQVITPDFSCQVPFSEDNIFSKEGILLNIHTEQLSLSGEILYENLSPIQYDIMGPFRYLPMECRHGIVSMHHKLKGQVVLNGRKIDFTDGTGYMEMDSGTSFPSSYAWVQANDFAEKGSIVAAVADIPFLKIHFRGCICIIQYKGKEYRLATYLGCRILSCTQNEIILKQGRYRLVIRIGEKQGHRLSAPKNGKMSRTIIEAASCPAEFLFYRKETLVFHLKSQHAGFEYESELSSHG